MRALHVRGAGVDGGEGVGDRAAGVVVAVDADPHRRRDTTSWTTSATQLGQHAAVGVAQRDHLGAGLVRRAQHLERVVAVGAVAVEEVLGVEEHLLPLPAQVADGVADHREVLLERGAQRQLDVPVVRLRDQGDHRAPLSRSAATSGSSAARTPARRVAPNAASLAWRRSSSSAARRKNSVSLGLAPGQPPSM